MRHFPDKPKLFSPATFSWLFLRLRVQIEPISLSVSTFQHDTLHLLLFGVQLVIDEVGARAEWQAVAEESGGVRVRGIRLNDPEKNC
jgi:hypothetical protein